MTVAPAMSLESLVEKVLTRIQAGDKCPPKTQEALREALAPHPACPKDCPYREGDCPKGRANSTAGASQ